MSYSDLPIVEIIVGLPCSGKTTHRNTLVESYKKREKHLVVISRDDIVEAFANANGLNYNEAFKALIGSNEVEETLNSVFKEAVSNNHDIVVDMPNLTAKSRLKWQPHKKCLVCCSIFNPPFTEILHRNNQRKEGKFTPETVLVDMRNQFEFPSTHKEPWINITAQF